MNFKNCVYVSWKIQILIILRHIITQMFTKKYYLLSKFSKLHNLETHFCELLKPRAPPFQKITISSFCLGLPSFLESLLRFAQNLIKHNLFVVILQKKTAHNAISMAWNSTFSSSMASALLLTYVLITESEIKI